MSAFRRYQTSELTPARDDHHASGTRRHEVVNLGTIKRIVGNDQNPATSQQTAVQGSSRFQACWYPFGRYAERVEEAAQRVLRPDRALLLRESFQVNIELAVGKALTYLVRGMHSQRALANARRT